MIDFLVKLVTACPEISILFF